MNGRVAKRYARALLALVTNDSELESWGTALQKLAAVIEDPELFLRLGVPDLPVRTRIEIIDKIAERLNLGFPLRSFAAVAARHGRLTELPAISKAYRELVDERLGRTRAILTFARPPADVEIQKIVDNLATIAGKTIIPTGKVDGTLLGGVIAELEGRTYDGSLATMITGVQQRLAR
jgi:F-type H+-transporting ATPase subunit delta